MSRINFLRRLQFLILHIFSLLFEFIYYLFNYWNITKHKNYTTYRGQLLEAISFMYNNSNYTYQYKIKYRYYCVAFYVLQFSTFNSPPSVNYYEYLKKLRKLKMLTRIRFIDLHAYYYYVPKALIISTMSWWNLIDFYSCWRSIRSPSIHISVKYAFKVQVMKFPLLHLIIR